MAKIYLLDDDIYFLDSLQDYLAPRWETKTSTCPQKAFFEIESHPPDLLLLDVEMPTLNGPAFLSKLEKIKCRPKVLVVSESYSRKRIFQLSGHGIRGHVLKRSLKKEINQAIEKVIKGGEYFSQEIERGLYSYLCRSKNDKIYEWDIFSPREKEVATLILEGLSVKEMAEQLSTSENTIKTHKKNIMRKTGTKSSLGLIQWLDKN